MQDVFSDITGQEQVVGYLEQALETNSVTHAYMLIGAKDSSKELIALRFAAALVAQDDEEELQTALRLVHPDIHIVSPQGTKTYVKEQVTELIHDISLAPIRSNAKVYIINSAEKFNESCANAFLKTLEEPPAGVCILMLTASEDGVLETLRSRCQILHCKSRGTAHRANQTIFDIMYDVANGANNATIFDAAQIIKSMSSYGLDELEAQHKEEEESASDFLSKGAQKTLEQRHKREYSAQERAALVEALEQSRAWLRDCLVTNQGAADMIAFGQVQNQTMEVATRVSSSALLTALQAADDVLLQISYNVTPQLAIEAYLFKIREALCPR